MTTQRWAIQGTGRDRGFSMIEVVVALGLLAGTLIAVGGLFIVGGRVVKSGRSASEALAVGKGIIEDLNGWAFTQLWSNFGFAGDATTYKVDTRACATADCAEWQRTLAARLGPDARATIGIDAIAQVGQITPEFVQGGAVAAKNVRVTVRVLWTEITGRMRQVSLVTTRN